MIPTICCASFLSLNTMYRTAILLILCVFATQNLVSSQQSASNVNSNAFNITTSSVLSNLTTTASSELLNLTITSSPPVRNNTSSDTSKTTPQSYRNGNISQNVNRTTQNLSGLSRDVNLTNIVISEPNLTTTTLSGPYPPDFMPDYIRNNGGVIVHIFLLAYVCLALGIVCDYYFLSSLEVISDALKLPPDVAGATFMAIGTSAPELFTSLIGVFISQDDIGTGTILGSAVFNLIFIPAICAFAAHFFCSQVARVSKFAILRDSIFYLVTTTVLLLSLKDNSVDWIESLSMLSLFGIYLIIMYYNAQLGDLVNGESNEEVCEKTPLLTPGPSDWDPTGADYQRRRSSTGSQIRTRMSSMNEDGELEEENWAESNIFIKVLMFPALLLFKITLPKPTKYCFILTFIISIVWISGLTYISVWMVNIIGNTFGIPETVSGLTILAAGTSIPELISSVLVVKRAGLADMALCNSIGSNIFDILIGLGLPWFIKSVVGMTNLGSLDPALTAVSIQSGGLPLTTFTLLLTIVALITTLSVFDWKLGLGVGFTCSIIYIAFITVTSVFEILFN